MPTEIRLKPETNKKRIAKETYGTIKKRLWDSRAFMEITLSDGKKVMVNKMDIRCAAMPKAPKKKRKKKK